MRGYRRLLRWAALPITDRRWAAPLSAVALGFGLFVGVAIGPGAAGTFATGAAQIIEIPGFGGRAVEGESGEAGRSPALASSGGGQGEDGDFSSSASAAPSPFVPLPVSEPESAGSGEVPEPEGKPSPPAAAPEPEKETLSGVVVHVNTAAGSYALAEPGGTLDVIHAATAPQPGTKVEVPIRSLANGTLAEAGTRIRLGKRTRANFSGVVTYVDSTSTAPAYTVSKRGVSVLVHLRPDPAGLAPTLPALGAFANVTVDIEELEPAPPAPSETATSPGEQDPSAGDASPEPLPSPPSCATDPAQPSLPSIQPRAVLWQRSIDADGAPFTSGDFEGIVVAVCPDSGELLVSADDIGESGEELLFDVPANIDITRLQVGDSILATATIAAGTLLLTGLADDERTKGADDAEAAQGDLTGS